MKQARWNIAAPFFERATDTWLDDFIDDPNLTFEKVLASGRPSRWDQGRRKVTGIARWLTYFMQAARSFAGRPHGIVTSFPQLAMCAGVIKRLTRSRVKIVAYTFNLGGLPPGRRRKFARLAATGIDRFVVHSPAEVAIYAAYLSVPEERLVFIPLQRGKIDVPRNEDLDTPFILAMGSAHRDYRTLISAVDQLGLRTIIVTRRSDGEQLPKSHQVSVLSDLTPQDCMELLARARLSVTPIDNRETASGQVTFVNAMMIGVAVVATRCPGTDGYVQHGTTGLLTEPNDVDDLREAIRHLWDDAALRERIAMAARAYAREHFSDEAAARSLSDILHSLAG